MTERIRRRAYLRCRDELDPKIPFPLFVVFFFLSRVTRIHAHPNTLARTSSHQLLFFLKHEEQ